MSCECALREVMGATMQCSPDCGGLYVTRRKLSQEDKSKQLSRMGLEVSRNWSGMKTSTPGSGVNDVPN